VVGVATRDVFSEQELARLRGFPEITRAELIRYFTLTSADEGSWAGSSANATCWARACSCVRWLGFVPDDVSSAPPEAVARLAERLGVASAQLRGYGEQAQTRTDHLRVLRYAGWRLVGAPEWKQLDEFLIARAMEHDSPKVLLGSVCEYLQRPAPRGERSPSAAPPVPAAPRRTPPPEVSLAPDVHAALRALTLRERAASPTTTRTYGRVALDAIETHAGALQHHWGTSPPTDTGLFSSANTAITSRRRRHTQAPARVPPAGILTSDATQLDHLAAAWGAGSRSALVEAALRLYLRLV